MIEKTTDLISKLKKFGEAIFLKNDNRDTLARNVISFVRGIEVGSKNYLSKKEKETTPFYRVGNMVSRNIDTFVLNNDAYPKLNYNDISLSFDGAVGRVGIGLEGFYSSGIRKVTSLTNKYSNGYLYFWVLSEKTQNIISEHAVGTTILHASSSIDYLSIDSNPNKNTREISDLLFSEIIKRLKLIDYLSVLKQELLEKYF